MNSSCRAAMTAAIPSIRPPFTQDGEVDYKGLRNIVEFCIASGSQTLMLTAGDSHYRCMSGREIREVTRVTCEQARGRAYIIGADRNHSTAAACELARECKEMGVDLFMTMPCDWGGSTTPDSLAQHYRKVGEVLPVMIVTNIYIPRGVEFGLAAVKKTLDLGANVLAIKDDMGGAFVERLCLEENGRVAIVAGGQKSMHLHMLPFGVDGYLSTMAAFRPEVAARYWGAIRENRLDEAREVVRTIDVPFFQHIKPYPGGFDACIHGMMEIYGQAKRWRRAPYHSLTDEEMERLRGGLAGLGLL